MKITLRPMTESYFCEWRKDSVQGYAQEKVRAGNFSEAESMAKAEESFRTNLPDGLMTRNHYIYSAYFEDRDEPVGMLWLRYDGTGTKTAFIFDFVVEPDLRGQGFGRKILVEAENIARSKGAQSISLHVFGHNHAARSLYESSGYHVTNLSMQKLLNHSA